MKVRVQPPPMKIHVLRGTKYPRGDNIIIELPYRGKSVVGFVDCCDLDKMKEYMEANSIDLDIVDFVVATHWHRDHMEGIHDLLIYLRRKKKKIRYFLASPYDSKLPEQIALEKYANKLRRNGDLIVGGAERGFDLGIDNYEFAVLGPSFPLILDGSKDTQINNASIVLYLRYHNVRILLGGDGETDCWDRISQLESLRGGGENRMRGHVFKVPHHGSVNGANRGHLMKIKPDLAIITGDNPLDSNDGQFPSKTVVEELQKYARVLCTYDHEDIAITVFPTKTGNGQYYRIDKPGLTP